MHWTWSSLHCPLPESIPWIVPLVGTHLAWGMVLGWLWAGIIDGAWTGLGRPHVHMWSYCSVEESLGKNLVKKRSWCGPGFGASSPSAASSGLELQWVQELWPLNPTIWKIYFSVRRRECVLFYSLSAWFIIAKYLGTLQVEAHLLRWAVQMFGESCTWN